MKRQKSAFIGTHGTGKTTLIYRVAAILQRVDADVGLLREVSRECPLPINESTSRAAQEWILFHQMSQEILLQEKCRNLLCDRSVLDNYAYLMRACGSEPLLENFLAQWTRCYDHIFFVPIIDEGITDDGTRSLDSGFRVDIQHIILKLLKQHNIHYIGLKGDERQNWADIVAATLVAATLPGKTT